MFVITNRHLRRDDRGEYLEGFDLFGPRMSEHGPADLRLVEITGPAKKPVVEAVPNWVTDTGDGARWKKLGLNGGEQKEAERQAAAGRLLPKDDPNHLPKGVGMAALGSFYAAKMIDREVRPAGPGGKKGRNLVMFVHGYNVDMQDAYEQCVRFEQRFGVVVLLFSWPARGGGIRGTAEYLVDKQQSQLSAPALDRAIGRLNDYLRLLRAGELEAQRRLLEESAAKKGFAAGSARFQEHVDRGLRAFCPYTINLMCHSMGNYLFKKLMTTDASYAVGHTVFDNVLLVAADTNHEDHVGWVERVRSRGRVYVVINEDDYALGVSRMKLGEEQKTRLGHCVDLPHARNARYIDLTDAAGVGRGHGPFDVKREENGYVFGFFERALNGERAERDELQLVQYYSDTDTYRPWA